MILDGRKNAHTVLESLFLSDYGEEIEVEAEDETENPVIPPAIAPPVIESHGL